MGTHVVIDSNIIQVKELDDFLSARSSNVAVIPIEIWFELYKQRCVDALRRGLEILGRYPDQVVVLRTTGDIMRLEPSHPNLVERMVLPDAGSLMRQMLISLSPEHSGEPEIQAQLKARWDAAALQNEGMLEGALDIVVSLPEMQAQMFSAAEVRIIRKKGRFTPEMFSSIFGAAEQLWEALSEAMELPQHQDSTFRASSLQFRIALGIVIYLLWWISKGSQSRRKIEAARNDVIDLFLAAQACYFDGFLTQDAKALWIHDNLKGALEAYRKVRFV
ncbi:MAG: hypothetical protein NVV74_16465 [Magnetospirillum sp.]|nr:hypothetical protein [Magnetospirillum sp.]